MSFTSNEAHLVARTGRREDPQVSPQLSALQTGPGMSSLGAYTAIIPDTSTFPRLSLSPHIAPQSADPIDTTEQQIDVAALPSSMPPTPLPLSFTAAAGAHPRIVPAAETQQARAAAEAHALGSAPFTSTLIPEEIPPSHFLYILGTSEGRDKIFKTLQYVLGVAIWFLQRRNIWPEESVDAAAYWHTRLSRNVRTIRNGRALFKLGRWIVTMFSFERAVKAALVCSLPAVADSSSSTNSPHAQRRVSRILILLVALRSLFSASRNALRDGYVVTSKHFLGITSSQLVVEPGDSQLIRFSNVSWLLYSAIDFSLNLHRLCDKRWFEFGLADAHEVQCNCDMSAILQRGGAYAERVFMDKKRNCTKFTSLDFEKGCPYVSSIDFFDAHPPNELSLICTICGARCVRNAAVTAPVAPSMLLVPTVIRRIRNILWCVWNNRNLWHTLMLQLKFSSDVALSLYMITRPSHSASSDKIPIAMSLAGLCSALVALSRIYMLPL